MEARGTGLRDGLIIGRPALRLRDSHALIGLELLASGDMDRLRIPDDLQRFEYEAVQWPRAPENFEAPLLLVKEFFRETARPLAAPSDRNLVFTDAYFGASFARRHEQDTWLAASILSSSLAGWFYLLTAAEFGVWKRRLLASDVRSFPLPESGDIGSLAWRFLVDIANPSTSAHQEIDWAAIDEAVLDLYELDRSDRSLVREGFYRASEQWSSGRERSSELVRSETDLHEYALSFASGIDAWLQSTSLRGVRAEIIELPPRSSIRVIRFVLEPRTGSPTVEIVKVGTSVHHVLADIGNRLDVRLGDHLVGERQLRVYGDSEVVIIKPASRRFWSAAVAMRDLDDVVADSLGRARDDPV